MKIKKFIKDNKGCLLFLLVLISFCLYLGTLSFRDADYFWHIKAGEYMIKNKLILVKDIFSWSLAGHRWFSHEWLFERILYRISLLFSHTHIFVYTFVCSFLLIFTLFWYNRKKIFKNISFTAFWLVALLLFTGLLSARPHMLSNFLLALCVLIYRDLFFNEDSKLIYFLPLVSLLWVNVHGGSSSLLYIMGIIFVVCGLFKFKFNKIETEDKRLSKKQLLKYGIFIFLSILMLFINPAGSKMLIYPYSNMTDSFMIGFITEWSQTSFSDFFDLIYIFFIVCILFIFIFSKKKIKLLDFVLFGIGVFLGLKSIRFWLYVYIFSSFFVFDYIGELKNKKGNLIILVSLIIMFSSMFCLSLNRPKKEEIMVSDKLIERIKDEKPERLYNYYDYGGYLIYNNIKVFVDGRADLYSEYKVLQEFSDICYSQGDYKALIKKYNFDYYLVPEDTSIAWYLKYSKKYDLIMKDKDVVFYKAK